MRAVFFGTPAIAVPALQALSRLYEVVGVVCQPDRPSGRGLRQRAPAIKMAAQELGLELHQPAKVRVGLDTWLESLEPEVAVVLAYGRILPETVLRVPRHGCINLHASLLPKYRGAAPIQWALYHGERVTGISLMQMDPGLDTGPVFCTRNLEIAEHETGADLEHRMALLAAEVVEHDLPKALSGALLAVPQDHGAATHAPPIVAKHCEIEWGRSAFDIACQVRALAPRPAARTHVGSRSFKILRARVASEGVQGPPGTISFTPDRRIVIQAGEGALEILEGQVEGRKALGARDLINGRALRDGDLLS